MVQVNHEAEQRPDGHVHLGITEDPSVHGLRDREGRSKIRVHGMNISLGVSLASPALSFLGGRD